MRDYDTNGTLSAEWSCRSITKGVELALKCRCGSHRFKPLGIQEGWTGRKSGRSPQVLFMVNCLECGTTLTCSRFEYALLRSREASSTLELTFFTA